MEAPPPVWQITDDTQLTLATIEALITPPRGTSPNYSRLLPAGLPKQTTERLEVQGLPVPLLQQLKTVRQYEWIETTIEEWIEKGYPTGAFH